jgi:hypothetical protein
LPSASVVASVAKPSLPAATTVSQNTCTHNTCFVMTGQQQRSVYKSLVLCCRVDRLDRLTGIHHMLVQ